MLKIDKKFLILFSVVAVVFIIASAYYYNKTVQADTSISWVDFRVYYEAAFRLSPGTELYDLDGGYFVYKYSPIFAFAVNSIRAVTPEARIALVVWYVVLFVSFALSMYIAKEISFDATGHPVRKFFEMAPLLFVFRYLILVNFISESPSAWPVFVKIFDMCLIGVVCPLYIFGLFFTREEKRKNNYLIIMALAVFFVMRSVVLNINRGQVNIIILLLLLFSCYFLMSKKDILAGMYLGIAIVIKLVPVIFLVYLFVKKKFKALFASLATFAALLFLPSFRWGMSQNIAVLKDWTTALGKTLPSEYLQHKNQSLMAMLSRFFSENSDIAVINIGQTNLTVLLFSIYAFFIAALIYSVIKNGRGSEKRDTLYGLSLFFAAMTILSPVGTKTTFVYMLLPFVILIKEAFERNLKDKLLNAGLILYGVLIYLNSSDILGDFSKVLHKYSVTTVCLLVVFTLLIYGKFSGVYEKIKEVQS